MTNEEAQLLLTDTDLAIETLLLKTQNIFNPLVINIGLALNDLEDGGINTLDVLDGFWISIRLTLSEFTKALIGFKEALEDLRPEIINQINTLEEEDTDQDV